jgi:hypothetical protein
LRVERKDRDLRPRSFDRRPTVIQMATRTVVHVFPIPRGMTADEAFAEIDVMGGLVEYRWWRLRFRWPFVRWGRRQVEEEN